MLFIYNIYSVDKENDSLKLISKTKGNFFQHQDLEFDTEYCYQVSCVDADGDEGPLSPVMWMGVASSSFNPHRENFC